VGILVGRAVGVAFALVWRQGVGEVEAIFEKRGGDVFDIGRKGEEEDIDSDLELRLSVSGVIGE
jgi:hypothetical protein